MLYHQQFNSSPLDILMLETFEQDLRSPVHGIDYQDISRINPNKPIGVSACWGPGSTPEYSCVAFALADGWTLLGPPVPVFTKDDSETDVVWTWWLQRERQEN